MSEKPINIYIFQPENRENTSNNTIVPSKNTITEIGMISPTVEKQNPTEKKDTTQKLPISLPDTTTPQITNKHNTPGNRCINGDPIDMATGAFIYEDNDYILPESTYDFKLIRRYSSIKNGKERQSIGYKWTLSVDTSITRDEELTVVTLPNSKAVEYIYKDGYYINKRGNSRQYTLIRPKENFIFKDDLNNFTYIYDKTGKIQSITDRYGNKTKYTYCDYGIKKVELSTGLSLNFTWKEMKISKVEDNAGRTVEYYYEDGILSKVKRCDKTTLTYEYDQNKNLITVTDGNKTTYVTNTYDEKGRVTVQHLTDGGFTSYAYDDKNRTNTYRDEANDITIKYIYDEKMDIIRVEYEDGTKETCEMNKYGFKIKETDRLGAETKYEYNENGKITKKTEPSGLITEYTYENNNLIKTTDNEGKKEEYIYDRNNKKIKEKILTGTEKNGKEKYLETEYTYDEKGRLKKISENGTTKEEYIYQKEHNRPSEIKKNSGETIKLKYDESLRIIERETEKGVEKYVYTPYNKIKTYQDREGAKTSFYYDNSWRLIKKVTGENNKKGTIEDKGETYTYDDMDRLTSKTDETGKTIKYKRNTNGDITEETLNGKTVYRYDYDKNFNIIKKYTYIEEKTYIEKYSYNACGEMIKKIPTGNYDKKTDDGEGYTFKRDIAGRITEVYDPNKKLTDTYTYDKRGNVILHKHCYSEENRELNNKIKENPNVGDKYTYDMRGKMTEKRQLLEISKNDRIWYAVTEYRYDAKENLTKEIKYINKISAGEKPSGEYRTVSREYDKADRLIRITDNSGAELKIEYDVSDNIIKQTRKISESIEEITEYTYDKCGRTTGRKTSEIHTIKPEKNEENIEKKAEKAAQETAKTTEKRKNRFLTVKEAEARIIKPEKKEKNISETKYSYDKEGKITEILYPNKSKEKTEYDESGKKTKIQVTDKENRQKYEITYKYDENGYISEKNENGIITAYKNNILGNCIEKTNPDGGKWTYEYDEAGKLIKQVSPCENIGTKEPAGEKYIYDNRGRLIQKTSPYGTAKEKIKYNLYGKIIEKTMPDGETINYSYDMGGRLIIAETPEGIREEYAYDAVGNVIANAVGKEITEYKNDLWGRVTTVKAPEGTEEHYTYDHRGNITEATDALGNTTKYSINIFGKAEKITYADGLSEKYTYDTEGNLIRQTKKSGKAITYAYDYLGNPTKMESEKDICTYEYDGAGKIIQAKSKGIAYSYTYDICGRLKEKKACGRTLLSYTYDISGNIQTVKDATGKETKYSYDLENRLKTIEENEQTLATFEYTRGGKKSKVICGDIETSYIYDRSGNLTGIITNIGNESLSKITYGYDDRGNCIWKNTSGKKQVSLHKNDETCKDIPKVMGLIPEGHKDLSEKPIQLSEYDIRTQYTYDGLNRLTEEEKTDGKEVVTYSYGYDKAGNRTYFGKRVGYVESENGIQTTKAEKLLEYTYNSLNQLQKVKDKALNKTKAFTYDADGSMLSDGKGMYTYDDFGHMVCAEMENGEKLICRYDAEGLRYEMEENGRLIRFIYRDRDVVLEESEETGVRYIRGNGRIIASDSEKARTYYHYVSDNLGSVCYVIGGKETDEETLADRIKCHYEYDAFGNIVEAEESIHNRFRFTGEQYDPVTGQYYLRARYYNPVIGRFTQADTYHGDGLNLYAYVGNNPVRYVDPSGHEKICAKDNGVKSGNSSKTKYYQVTSNENAQALVNSDNPALKGREFQQVYVWTVQPTLEQAQNSGARYLDTVIEFETSATFSKDTSMDDSSLWNIARISDRPGPISISNVKVVGFKKEKKWWQFWKK